MKRLNFTIVPGVHGRVSDAAFPVDDENVTDVLDRAMWEAIYLNVQVTIGGQTMPAAMWASPEHWAEDWADTLSVDLDDAAGAVLSILTNAITEEQTQDA